MRQKNIYLWDTEKSSPIKLLIGEYVAAIIYTGRQEILARGLIAIETRLGWTLKEKQQTSEDTYCFTLALTSLSLLVKDACISNLWKLDVLQIIKL